MERDESNITKTGLMITQVFSEYQNPVANIMTAAPTTEAQSFKIFKDEHIESTYFYEY